MWTFKSVSPKGPYDLSTDKGKFELAKDVTAFANSSGGLIVCGFKAEQRPTELYEVAEKPTPFKCRSSTAARTRRHHRVRAAANSSSTTCGSITPRTIRTSPDTTA